MCYLLSSDWLAISSFHLKSLFIGGALWSVGSENRKPLMRVSKQIWSAKYGLQFQKLNWTTNSYINQSMLYRTKWQ